MTGKINDYKNRIVCVASLNTENEKDEPYPKRIYEDMALTLRYIANKENGRIEDFRVTEKMLEEWGVTEDEAFRTGESNYDSMFRMFIDSTGNLMKSIDPDGDIKKINKNAPLFILSNYEYYYGATLMFKAPVLDNLKKILGEDYYVVPSSINEILISPVSIADIDYLKGMILKVNSEIARPEDIMSWYIYRYDCSSGKLVTVK